MFRILIQVLIFTVLVVVAFEFIKGDKAQSWSYCGQALKQEKLKMEAEVKQSMRALGDSAEVTWREDSRCISASVTTRKSLSFLMHRFKEYF